MCAGNAHCSARRTGSILKIPDALGSDPLRSAVDRFRRMRRSLLVVPWHTVEQTICQRVRLPSTLGEQPQAAKLVARCVEHRGVDAEALGDVRRGLSGDE